jgi:ribosomal protein RSM22 (predicted rRNA methylase)
LIPCYAAAFHIFNQLKKRIPDFKPNSILDFGCGPGSALLAAREFYTFGQVVGIDSSEYMLDIFKQFTSSTSLECDVKTMRYLSLATTDDLQSDLVVSAFAVSELQTDAIRKLTITNLWKQTRDVLVLIDRGTPIGAQMIADARQHILDSCKDVGQDCYVVAPCPHELACPMLTNPHKHWCHFSQRYQMINSMVVEF